MKTSELIGPALDWAVAKCVGRNVLDFLGGGVRVNGQTETGRELPENWDMSYMWHPSTNWSQGGPIMERENVSVQPGNEWPLKWIAYKGGRVAGPSFYQHGDTPLISAMRCYVASKMGDEIEIPKELL